MADKQRTPTQGVRFHQGDGGGSAPVSSRRIQNLSKFARRHTPYQKTPHSRKIRGAGPTRLVRTPQQRRASESSPTSAARRRNATVSPNEEIVNKTWKVYKVSPLFKFSHNAADLKTFSKLLSAHITAENRKGFGVGLEDEQAHSATISVYKGLKAGPVDKESIQIILKSRPKRFGEDPKVVLTCVLLCVHLGEEVSQKVPSDFTVMPVLLSRGLVGPEKQLMEWLQTQFDCYISRLTFSSLDLSWMVAMWSGFVPEKRVKPVELVYNVPAEVEGLSKITLTLNSRNCKQLWDSIHNEEDDEDEFHEDEVTAFVESLEAHFYHHFRIHIQALHLARVGSAIAYIASEGKLKIFTPEKVCQVLSHLTELAVEQVVLISGRG